MMKHTDLCLGSRAGRGLEINCFRTKVVGIQDQLSVWLATRSRWWWIKILTSKFLMPVVTNKSACDTLNACNFIEFSCMVQGVVIDRDP